MIPRKHSDLPLFKGHTTPHMIFFEDQFTENKEIVMRYLLNVTKSVMCLHIALLSALFNGKNLQFLVK